LVISGKDKGERQGGGGGPNENEPTGEAATLIGKKMARFGDLAQREKPPELVAAAKKAKNKYESVYSYEFYREEEKKQKKSSKDIVDPKKATKFVTTINQINFFRM
jgi:hypothetical protein